MHTNLSSSSLLYGKNVLKVFLQMEYKICSTYETNVIFPTKLSTHIFLINTLSYYVTIFLTFSETTVLPPVWRSYFLK